MIHQKCSDFCCSNVLENSLYKHSQVDINLFQKERNLHPTDPSTKNLYLYLHVLDGSLFCVSSQEFGAAVMILIVENQGPPSPTHGQFWTQRGHILNHRVEPAGNEVTNPWGRYVGGLG